MEILDSEKRRARNLIWNAAADYSFEPDFKAYDEDGRADLYWNSIIGAVRKNYGAETIEGLFESLHGCSKEQLFEQLLWLGLESQLLFGMMGADKKKAKRGQWRIPEKTLFLVAICGRFRRHIPLSTVVPWDACGLFHK